MIRWRGISQLGVAAMVAFAAWSAPVPCRAWGGATHHYIAQNYSQHLPPFMDGLRAYDAVVDLHVTDPDTRKSTTPGESYRHYIDIDVYPEFLAGTLTHNRLELEGQYGASTVLSNGIVPWAAAEAVVTLTRQFHLLQWSDAALTIADLCHYVGDADQPLHCTENYDGQLTGNSGIHSRYETSMMATYLGSVHTTPTPVTYYPSTVEAMFATITTSWAGAGTVLQADNTARAASGNVYNATYYASLWANTQALTTAKISEATVLTASLVYTAWKNAGQPLIPGSSAGVVPSPVAGVRFDAGPSPFRDRLTIHYSGSGPLRVEVLDVRGARVAQLVDGASGEGSVTWNRSGAAGRSAPGLYFIRLSGPAVNVVRRVTVLE